MFYCCSHSYVNCFHSVLLQSPFYCISFTPVYNSTSSGINKVSSNLIHGVIQCRSSLQLQGGVIGVTAPSFQLNSAATGLNPQKQGYIRLWLLVYLPLTFSMRHVTDSEDDFKEITVTKTVSSSTFICKNTKEPNVIAHTLEIHPWQLIQYLFPCHGYLWAATQQGRSVNTQ